MSIKVKESRKEKTHRIKKKHREKSAHSVCKKCKAKSSAGIGKPSLKIAYSLSLSLARALVCAWMHVIERSYRGFWDLVFCVFLYDFFVFFCVVRSLHRFFRFFLRNTSFQYVEKLVYVSIGNKNIDTNEKDESFRSRIDTIRLNTMCSQTTQC